MKFPKIKKIFSLTVLKLDGEIIPGRYAYAYTSFTNQYMVHYLVPFHHLVKFVRKIWYAYHNYRFHRTPFDVEMERYFSNLEMKFEIKCQGFKEHFAEYYRAKYVQDSITDRNMWVKEMTTEESEAFLAQSMEALKEIKETLEGK